MSTTSHVSENERNVKAVKYFQQAAQKGHSGAQYCLGYAQRVREAVDFLFFSFPLFFLILLPSPDP
jgi:hypothetical protein